MTTTSGLAGKQARTGLVSGLAMRASVFCYERLLGRPVAEGRLDLVLAHADITAVLAHVSAGDKAGLGRS